MTLFKTKATIPKVWSTLSLFVDPIVAEALVAVILEGNALQIVNAVIAVGKSWCEFGHIIDGIKDRLSRIEHVKKYAN